MGGLAACALALAGVTAALVPGDVSVPGNHITAGHLSVHVNHGRGSDLNFRNLAPGEHRTGDQLITGDMAGVGTADLTLRISVPHPGVLDHWASLTVRYSDPEPVGAVRVGSTCTPAGGYPHAVTFPTLDWGGSTQTVPLGVLTGDDAAVCVRLDMGLSPTAGNDVQGTGVALDLTYVLEQTSAAGP